MADLILMTPYQSGLPTLEGAISANPLPRPLAMSQWFGQESTTTKDRINVDYEFGATNLIARFVAPTIDAAKFAHPNFGTKEMTFGYAKAAVESPDLTEISQRMFGQPFGAEQNFQANYDMILAKDMDRAEKSIENLEELCATHLLVHGSYTTAISGANAQHPLVTFDWGRTKLENSSATTQASRNANVASVYNDWIPEVNLTTLKANTSTDVGGGLSWGAKDNTSGTPTTVTPVAAVDPVEQLRRMDRICAYRAGSTEAFVMSDDAWAYYKAALKADKYKDLWDLTKNATPRITNPILDMIHNFQGWFLRGYMLDDVGMTVPIFGYSGTYDNIDTGVRTKYFPDGYVVALPSKSYGKKIYGRIMHPKAAWLPAKRWVNQWGNTKTGYTEWELHSSFLLGHTDIDTVVSWKVCSTAPAATL